MAQSHLAQVQTVLGERLIQMDILRIEIQALRYIAQKERWQQFAAMMSVGLLLGAVLGCAFVTWVVR